MVFLAGMTYGLGLLLIALGDLIVLRRGVTVISSDDVSWRFFYAFAWYTFYDRGGFVIHDDFVICK